MRKERLRAQVDPNIQCAFDMLMVGASCKKILFDVDTVVGKAPKARRDSLKFREWEEAAAVSWPFVSRAVDPMTVFPAPGLKKPLPYLLEVQTRWAGDIWAKYGEA